MDIVILLLVIGVSILLIKCVNPQIENKKFLKQKPPQKTNLLPKTKKQKSLKRI